MKTMKKVLAILLVAVMLPVNALAATLPFSDVPAKAWYRPAVEYCYENKLFSGTSTTTFSPNQAVTRAMFVVVLANKTESFDKSKYSTSSFTDVPTGKYYSAAVEWAAENGIVTGTGSGKFQPNSYVTREQMASILYRYAEKTGNDTSITGSKHTNYTDFSKVSSYAKDSIKWALSHGIMNGKTSTQLSPKSTAIRAEVAQIFFTSKDVLKNTAVDDSNEDPAGEVPALAYKDPAAMTPQEREEVCTYFESEAFNQAAINDITGKLSRLGDTFRKYLSSSLEIRIDGKYFELYDSVSKVTGLYGQPTEKLNTGYSYDTWIYADDPAQLLMLMVENEKVVGVLTLADDFRFHGVEKNKVSKLANTSASTGAGSTFYPTSEKAVEAQLIEDSTGQSERMGILVIDQQSKKNPKRLTAAVKRAVAKEAEHLMNAVRDRAGLPPITVANQALDACESFTSQAAIKAAAMMESPVGVSFKSTNEYATLHSKAIAEITALYPGVSCELDIFTISNGIGSPPKKTYPPNVSIDTDERFLPETLLLAACNQIKEQVLDRSANKIYLNMFTYLDDLGMMAESGVIAVLK